MDDILKLKELLDADTFAPVAKQLQQKAWLLHWWVPLPSLAAASLRCLLLRLCLHCRWPH